MTINKTVYVSLEEARFFELCELICIYVCFIVTYMVKTGTGETDYSIFSIMLCV